ncbi:FIG00732058: hypothetical protein [Klebsiella pneumoniae ISC21]|nr:FIG00732058: hypothetical protein [Klebsiella pneumoniae ISC21]
MMRRKLFLCDAYHKKERYKLHLRQEIIMKLFHKIIAKFSVPELLSSALSRPLTRRIAHQKRQHWRCETGKRRSPDRWPFVFYG